MGFSIQDEAMDVARFAPLEAHYHADVIYLLPYMGIKKGARALWYSELGLHQFGFRLTAFVPRWAYILVRLNCINGSWIQFYVKVSTVTK